MPGGRRVPATPDAPAVVLIGVVRGDPRFPGGAAIVTSRVLVLDPGRAVARTRSTSYRLGTPSRVFLRWLRELGHTLHDFSRHAADEDAGEGIQER
ncbi:MAG TPA: hypothetical protein VKH82_04190 [Candidatus Binatia bacterium]|jgi:hypothetical protein|nr:hypothetical protein [Candidatus Binatia bacterium]